MYILLRTFAASTDMIQGIYLGKDDPEIIALMQQAELLSSLALEVNIENTQQTTNDFRKVRKFAPHYYAK